MKHVMQHAESPTWCVHCGTFDIYCASLPCTKDRSGRYDSRKDEVFNRMASELFGESGIEP